MENVSILEKISCKYISGRIFDYIKDENYKFKLFLHSKKLQKKFELELIDFKERYIIKSKFNTDNYLCCYTLFNVDVKNFDKNIIFKKLEDDLKKVNININIIHEYLLNDLKKIVDKLNEKEKENKLVKYYYFNKQISIFSPFFEFLTKSEYIDILTIPISIKLLEKFNLKNDYIAAFEYLNKLNIKHYPSIIFDYKNTNDINYLKEFKIRFNKIKRLTLTHEYSVDIDNYNFLFKTLFSFNNIEKNLVHLNLYVGFLKRDKIDRREKLLKEENQI